METGGTLVVGTRDPYLELRRGFDKLRALLGFRTCSMVVIARKGAS